MSATETGRQIGVALKRKEDDPLLRGRGSFVDNIVIPGTLTMAVVRSPYAHAKISSIDTAAAKAAEGVVAVFTGAELRDDWAAAMPCAWPVTEDMKSPEHFPLAASRSRTAASFPDSSSMSLLRKECSSMSPAANRHGRWTRNSL